MFCVTQPILMNDMLFKRYSKIESEMKKSVYKQGSK